MPERVTREERTISLAIEKARNAKEQLALSLENNRNPSKDESEAVKLKRPKAEKDTTKFKSNDGPTTLHAYAGDITKMFNFMKSIGDFTWGNMVVNTDKNGDFLLKELNDFIKGDEKTQKVFLSKLKLAAENYKQKLQKAIREEDYMTNPFLDEEDRRMLTERIANIDRTITNLGRQFREGDPSNRNEISRMISSLSGLVTDLEKEFRRLPEPRDEESDEALDPDYDKFMQR